MNISTPPSAALPPLPPLKKDGLPSNAMTIVKAMGGLQRLRRTRRMIPSLRNGSQRFAYMGNLSNHCAIASRFAAVMPPIAYKPFPNLALVNVPNAHLMNIVRRSERPVRIHPEEVMESTHDGNEGSVAKDLSPHNGTWDASEARFLRRLQSSSGLGTTVTTPTTTELDADEDAMSWCAPWEEISIRHTSRDPSERGGLGAESRRTRVSMRIEETSCPTPDECSATLRPPSNFESHHVPGDFRYGIGIRERAEMDTSQEHFAIANPALEAQSGRMASWNTQGAWKRAGIDTNDCKRPRHENETGLTCDDSGTTVRRDCSTSQTTTVGYSGVNKLAETDNRSMGRETWFSAEDTRNLADNCYTHHVYESFRTPPKETSTAPKRGRKRRLPRSLAHKANLDRTAKRPRATPPKGAMWSRSVIDMELSMDIATDANDASPETVAWPSPMDVTGSTQNEYDASPSLTEPNAMNTSVATASWNGIKDQMHDVTIWREEDRFEEPVTYTGKRLRFVSWAAGEHDLTQRDVMQVVKGGGAEGNMRDISSNGDEGYRTQESEQRAYWDREEYEPMQPDVMHDITSECGQANDQEWNHAAVRNAEEYDMHETSASMEEEFSQRDQHTLEAEARGCPEADGMQVVASRNLADGARRSRHIRKRERNPRKAGAHRPAQRNAFKSRKRRTRRAGRSSKSRHKRVETHEPMTIC